jgi:hypothetical protein
VLKMSWKLLVFELESERDFRCWFLVFCGETRGGLRLHFWLISAGFHGGVREFFHGRSSTKIVKGREAYVSGMGRALADFWCPMHAIYNNFEWLRSSQHNSFQWSDLWQQEREISMQDHAISNIRFFSISSVIIRLYYHI